MKLIQKYFLLFLNLIIMASLCFSSQYNVFAQSQTQVLVESVSPPLFPDLTWKNLGSVQKDVHVYGQILTLNGDMFEAIENFNIEIPEDVFSYYSIKNLESLGWKFMGNESFESAYWHPSGGYLTVQIVECPDSETDYCVNVWQSADSNNVPPPAEQSSTSPIYTLVAFSKTSPANGATIPLPASTFQLLKWGDAQIGSTDRYQYCIDETNNQQCDSNNWLTRNSLYSGPDFTVLSGRTYYWQVRVRDAGIYANNGTWWSFKVQTGGPAVSSIVRFNPNTSATAVSSVIFKVEFNQIVTGVDIGDFVLNTTGILGASISGVSGSGQTYNVTVNTGMDNGSIQLNLVDNDSIINNQNTPLGGTGTGNGNYSGETYTIDKTPPTVSSVHVIAVPTNLISVNYAVTFSENVTGVDVNDFNVFSTGVTGASVSSVSGTGSVYTVKVNTGNGNGTIRLDVIDNDTVIDKAANPLGGVGAGNGNFTSFEVYPINRNIEAYVAANLVGTYKLNPSQSVRDNYVGVDGGPLKVISTDGTPILAAIREAWAVNGVTTSFFQLMGLPLNQVSDKYVFPAYNNVTLDDQLRIANVDTIPTTVTVTIGGVLRGTYTLQPSEALRVNYAGVDSGPVIVDGTDGVDIISSIREAWAVGGVTKSFTQLMGLSATQLSDKYVFPGYNNVTLNEQLRIGNVDTVSTTVTVTIGGVLRGTYTLASNEEVRVNYAGLDSGPVIVDGTDGVDIIASIREAWAVNGVTTSFAQLMGLPSVQLSDQYIFPAYNNVTLNDQLRIGNVDTVATTVTVTIGGVLRGTYTLQPNEAVRVNYAGVDSGPVVVKGTNGVDIISSIREAWAVNGVTQSFTQLMGLSANQLDTTFLFPAYNNVTLNEQLRIGTP